jgi:hypothetical protein
MLEGSVVNDLESALTDRRHHTATATPPPHPRRRWVIVMSPRERKFLSSFWSHVIKLAPPYFWSHVIKNYCVYVPFFSAPPLGYFGRVVRRWSVCGVKTPSCGLLFFGSIYVASVLGVLPSNDRNLVEFSGACGHRTTLESGYENQCSEDAAPLGVAYTMRAHDA